MQSSYLNKTKLNTFEVATCGQGASCAGQCSALGASLCPSENCTEDPGTCEIDFNHVEDQGRERSTATLSGSDLKWCTNTKHWCLVRTYEVCCFNPNCLKWSGRKVACDELGYGYLTGKE